MKTIVFPKAHVKGVRFKVGNQSVLGFVEFVGRLTPEIAKELGAECYDSKHLPRGGFTKIDLESELVKCKCRLAVAGASNFVLEIDSPTISKFQVVRIGGRKKAKSTFLACKFLAAVNGREQELLAYLKTAGMADGKLEITEHKPEQQEMPLDANAAAETARAAQAAAAGARSAVIDQTVIDGLDDAIEEDPRAWTIVDGWPVPNRQGIYNRRHAQEVAIKAKGAGLDMYVIQAAEGKWVWGYWVQGSDFGFSHPLSGAPLATKRAALCWILKAVQGRLQGTESGSNKGRQQIAALMSAIDKRLIEEAAEALYDVIDPDGANGEPAPSFLDRMRSAKNADEGRAILTDLETAIRAVEAEGGIRVHTVGDLPNTGYRGFSTVSAKEWRAIEKRIRANGHPEIAAQLADLVNDGTLANAEFRHLVAQENAEIFHARADSRGRQASAATDADKEPADAAE